MRAYTLLLASFSATTLATSALAQHQWPIISCSGVISELRPLRTDKRTPGAAHVDWHGEAFLTDRGWGWSPNFIRFWVEVNDYPYHGPSGVLDQSTYNLPGGPPGIWITKSWDISLAEYPIGYHKVSFKVQTRTLGEHGGWGNDSTFESYWLTMEIFVYNPVAPNPDLPPEALTLASVLERQAQLALKD